MFSKLKLSILFVSFSLAYSQFTTIPACARKCAEDAVNGTGCSTTDNRCLCQNNAFVNTVQNCIFSSCPLEDRQGASAQFRAVCAAVGISTSSTATSTSSTSSTTSTSSATSGTTSATTGSGTSTTTSETSSTSQSTSTTSSTSRASSGTTSGTTTRALANTSPTTSGTTSRTGTRTSDGTSTFVVVETIVDNPFNNSGSMTYGARMKVFGIDLGVALGVVMATSWITGFGLAVHLLG